MNPVVFTDDLALRINQLTLSRYLRSRVLGRQITIDEHGIVAIGHKTNLLRLGLFRYGQLLFTGYLAHFRLGHFTKREERTRQLILRQLPKEVRLVLLRIATA